MLPLRIVQLFFALLVLALSAYVVSWWNTKTILASPGEFDFLIFNGVWTSLIAIPYLTLAPRYFPNLAHKFGILAMEAITMIFWFAGFIATGAYIGGLLVCRGSVCSSAQASIVLAAFDWALFTATTAMATMHILRTRATTNDKSPPELQAV